MGIIMVSTSPTNIICNQNGHYHGQHLTNQHYLSIIDALCVIMLIIGE